MIIAIDIGGTKIATGLVTGRKVTGFSVSPTGHLDKVRLIKIIVRLLRRSTPRNDKNSRAGRNDRINAIGISIAGQVDMKRGIFLGGPNLPAGLRNFPLKKYLAAEFRLPVVIDNDVHCFLLAEATYGAARGYKSAVGIMLGTGIGGAIIRNGKLVHGAKNTAGEFGHMTTPSASPSLEGENAATSTPSTSPSRGRGKNSVCSCGEKGHLEAYAGGRSMAERYRELTGRHIDAKELEARYLKGDRHARQIINEATDALSAGLINILVSINPECIVIGGGLSNFRALVQTAIRKTRASVPFAHLKKTPIVLSELGAKAPLIGAALLAQQTSNNQ